MSQLNLLDLFLSNLLNGFLHFGSTILKMGQRRKRRRFWGNKIEEKQVRATIVVSVDGKRTVFPVKLKLKRE